MNNIINKFLLVGDKFMPKDLPIRRAADKLLRGKAFNTA